MLNVICRPAKLLTIERSSKNYSNKEKVDSRKGWEYSVLPKGPLFVLTLLAVVFLVGNLSHKRPSITSVTQY